MTELSLEEMMELDGVLEDQTQEVQHGDFDNTPKEGPTVGRLISYIELGKHDGGSFKGKKKPDAEYVRLEFELVGPDNWIEWEDNGVQKKAGQIVSIRLKKSLSDKSMFKKLFKKLTYGRPEKTHLAQCLGEAFIINIYLNKVSKDGNERTYVNLHKDGEFGISAPFVVDPITKNKSYYDIPAQTQPIRWFLWNKPQQSNWDALFIDGTKEVTKKDAAGVEVKENVSKNWLQELILSAKNFQGSPLQALLAGVANLPTTEAQAAAQAQPAVAQEQAAGNVPVQADPAPAASVAQPVSETAAPTDPLAALGLKTVAA